MKWTTLQRMKKVLFYIGLEQKKNAQAAEEADLTVKPNSIRPDDIYKERNALRKQKVNNAFL